VQKNIDAHIFENACPIRMSYVLNKTGLSDRPGAGPFTPKPLAVDFAMRTLIAAACCALLFLSQEAIAQEAATRTYSQKTLRKIGL